MAFVNDDLVVIFHKVTDLAFARQRLHDSYIDLAGELGLAAAQGADDFFADAEERLQAFLPLPEQLGPVHKHQGIHTPPGNERCGTHGFTEGRWREEDTGVMCLHGGNGRFLVRTHSAEETDIQRMARETLVFHQWRDLILRQQRLHGVPATTWQGDMLGKILRAANDSGFVLH